MPVTISAIPKERTRFEPTVFDPWWEQKAKRAANAGLDIWSFLAGGDNPADQLMAAGPAALGTVATRGIRQMTDPDVMRTWLQGLPTGLRERLTDAVKKWTGGYRSTRPQLGTNIARAVNRPGAPEERTRYREALDQLFGETHPGGSVRVYRGSQDPRVLVPRTAAAQEDNKRALEAEATAVRDKRFDVEKIQELQQELPGMGRKRR